MNSGRTIFSQIMDYLPNYEFQKCVHRYHGNHRIRSFPCFNQFLCMAFAQLTYRESLRDIETCLRSLRPKLYHAGFRGNISRATLADANEKRDWRIYADFAMILIAKARALYSKDDFGVDWTQPAYAFDSTTIDLCLSLFPWAQFRKRKAAVKLHTLMDIRGNIPCFIYITDGKVHDANTLGHLFMEPGSFYIFDRGYLHFARLYSFSQNASFFVIRAKSNLAFTRQESLIVDKSTGLRADQRIVLQGPKSSIEYPDTLRRIRFFDQENQRTFVFLTNNFLLPALTIPRLYKCR